jgi:ABC-2 type transport system ATP-binding protein
MFAELSKLGIEVTSMRNKANRLEELFIRMIASDDGETDVQPGTGVEEEEARVSGEGLPR